jgi:hypothetical protein
LGADLAAVGVGEGECAFGVAGDLEFAVVVVAVVSVAQIDQELGVGGSVGAVFEDVVGRRSWARSLEY